MLRDGKLRPVTRGCLTPGRKLRITGVFKGLTNPILEKRRLLLRNIEEQVNSLVFYAQSTNIEELDTRKTEA